MRGQFLLYHEHETINSDEHHSPSPTEKYDVFGGTIRTGRRTVVTFFNSSVNWNRSHIDGLTLELHLSCIGPIDMVIRLSIQYPPYFSKVQGSISKPFIPCKLLNLRALKISSQCKIYVFQCVGMIFNTIIMWSLKTGGLSWKRE